MFAQQRNQEIAYPPHRLTAIDQAYKEGRISLDQKVLYQLYAIRSPERVPENLRSEIDLPIKCGTPAILEFRQYEEKLQSATLAEIEPAGKTPRIMQAEETYTSPGGKFLIYYTTSGDDAVPATDSSGVNGVPDYVEWVAAAADSSWRHEVQNLGYTDPVISPSNPYEIHIQSLNAYGETRPSGGTTYIVVHNNFDGFPSNTDPEGNVKGAIKATMAHELKHAIQYANSEWYQMSSLHSPHSTDWSEMDATLMEEIVYDNVNDYYNYLFNSSSIFSSPANSIPGAYWQVSWFLFFEEFYGSQFWVNVWTRIKKIYNQEKNSSSPQYLNMATAIQQALEEDFNHTFSGALVNSHLWHFASGPDRSPSDYGFEERLNYPDPAINTSFFGVDSLTVPATIDPLAANYIELNPTSPTPGFIRVVFTRSTSHIGMGLIAYLKDGRTEQIITTEGEALVLPEQTTWEWDNIDRMGVVIANSSENNSGSYELKVITDIPEEIALRQNYPNPFYPGTTIPFTLNQESKVQLRVYDVLGRLVQTLIDETLSPGYYDPKFQAIDLSSGVYIYQLVTDEEVLTKKMTLIK